MFPRCADPIKQYPAVDVWPVLTPSEESSRHNNLFLLSCLMLLKVNCFSLYKEYSLGKLFINFVVKVAKSLADEKWPSSGNPVEFTKFVSVIPIAPA